MLSRQLLRDLLYGSAIKRPYSPSRRKSRTRKRAIFFPFAGKRFHRRRVYYCANRGVHPVGDGGDEVEGALQVLVVRVLVRGVLEHQLTAGAAAAVRAVPRGGVALVRPLSEGARQRGVGGRADQSLHPGRGSLAR